MGSNPAEDDGFLRTISNRGALSFGEVKPAAPCCNILRHVKETHEYDRNILLAKLIISFAMSF
jgi:hypothetical protein